MSVERQSASASDTFIGPALNLSWRDPIHALPAIVGRLVASANPIKIVLFGSFAKAQAKEGSDLDLLVVVDHADDIRQAAIGLQDSLTGVAIPVDIIVATPDFLKKYRDFPGYVYKAALDEGVCVYERRE